MYLSIFLSLKLNNDIPVRSSLNVNLLGSLLSLNDLLKCHEEQ